MGAFSDGKGRAFLPFRRTIFLLLYIFGCIFLPAHRACAQANNLKVQFDQITIDPSRVFHGMPAGFPNPVMSVITVKDQNNRYVHGLADTSKWLGADDSNQLGQKVSNAWKTILETHADNPLKPKNPDVKQTRPEFRVRELGEIDNMGLSISMAMDYSGSMIDYFNDAEAAAKVLVRMMTRQDRMAVYKFSADNYLMQDFTSDTTKLIRAIEKDSSSYSGTNLYDAVYDAITSVKNQSGRRIVIVYTDGRDHELGHTVNQVIDYARENGVPLYTIGLFGLGPVQGPLQIMSDYTGGLYYFAPSIDSLKNIYRKIYGHISGYYVLAHTSPDPFTNGKKRVVDLTMDYLEEIGSTKLHHTGRDTIHYQVPFIPPNVTPRLTASTDSVSPGPAFRHYAMAGDTAFFDITVRNTGRGNAAETRVVFAPGDSLSAIRYSIAPDSVKGDSIYWFFPRIDSGDSARIRVTTRLRPKMPRGDKTIMSRVRVTALDDALPADNTASAVIYVMGRPDLIPRVTPVADTLSPGKTFHFLATVRNAGNADLSASFKAGLFIENDATPVLEKTIASLALHDSVFLDFELSLPATGRYRLKVTADAAAQIPETNENNNSSETTVIVGGPDLIPRVTPVADTLSPGKPFHIQATVRNAGNADCVLPFQAGLYAGDAVDPIQTKSIASLALHDSVRLDFELSLPSTGRYRMRVTADPSGQIAELREDNNSSETTAIVGGPDFTVRVLPVAGTASPGYPVGIRAVVRNRGTADCVLPFQVGLFQGPAVSAIASTTLPALALHDSARIAFTASFPLAGRYSMRVKADSQDQIPELDENNNSDSTSVAVGVDTLHVRLGGFSLGGTVRGVSARFPDRVFAQACVMDQNSHPVRGLADATGWQGINEPTPLGETVGGVWASLSEVHEENPSYPPSSDVKPTLQVTAIAGSKVAAAFVLDASSLMAPHGARVRSDLRGMIRRFTEGDRAAIIGFSGDVVALQALTSDTASLGSALSGSYSGQNRRLYDALYSGIESVRGAASRSPVLAVTAGGDAGSSHTREDVIRAAQESGVPVHVIAFDPGGSSPDMETLAGATGGWARTVAADSQFTAAAAFMEDAIRNYYQLAFASSDTTEDRTRRDVRLVLRTSGASDTDTGVYRAPLGRANLAVRVHVKGSSFTVSGGDTTWFVRTGESARYSASVLNIGHQDLSNIHLSDVLPHSFVPESIPFNHRIAGDSLVWNLDSLPIRGVVQFSYTYRADTLFSLVNVPFTNALRADCPQDTLPRDNRASDTVVYIPLKPPDFVVSVAGQGDSLSVVHGDSVWFTFAGKTVRYSVKLDNIGELACSDISVTNVLPPELTLVDFSGPPHTQRGDTLFWTIDVLPSRGGTRIATYSCKVDSFLPPWEVPLINKAWAHSDQEQITGNNTGIDTLYIAPLIPPDPQVRVEPSVVGPGDSVRVQIMTPVTVNSYDIIVFYETGEHVTDYADPFIRLHPDLKRGEWTAVVPAYPDSRMRTNNTQERVGVVIVTTDLWNVTRSDTAYFTIRSTDAFFLDRNVFRPASGERMGFRFRLSSNRRAEILLYDISGAFVKQVADAWFAAGWNEGAWDGKDDRGDTVGSGVYLAMIRSGDFRKAMKFILVR
jgi:VWFA-related protein